MSDLSVLRKVLRSDEHFFWHTTGSIADLRYNPLFWILTIVTLGMFVPCLYYKRIYTSYALTDKRLLIISGIFTKTVDEIELFRVTDSVTNQTFIDVWADIGDITINSSDLTGQITMRKIPNPYYIRDTLRNQYTKIRQTSGTVLLETLNAPTHHCH